MRRFTRGVRFFADWIGLPGGALLAALFLLSPMPANAGPCTEQIAERVSIDQLNGDLARYEGHCVSVTGIRDGVRIFADQDAI